MTNGEMKEVLDKKLVEYRQEVMQSVGMSGDEMNSAIIGLIDITYSQGFVDGANYILNTVNSTLTKVKE